MEDLALPKVIEIEATATCNLRCRMCHVSFMPEEVRPVLRADLIDRLEVLRGRRFIIGSGFEPMMNPEFALMLRKLARLEAQLELVTNGTLIDDSILSALADCDVRLLTFSFDGIRPETFEHIRRRAQYGQTIKNILAVRERFSRRDTIFCINTTMMRRNLEEIPEIVDFWERANFDVVRFLTMVVREPEPELLRNSLYPIRHEYYRMLDAEALKVIEQERRISVSSKYFAGCELARRFPANFFNGQVVSAHPRARVVTMTRQDAETGPYPGMWFPCRSPWSGARILSSGEVQLCYQFSVGNLHDQSFADIWQGAKANKARALVAAQRDICPTCDYFRFCLSKQIDHENLENYFSSSLAAGLDRINFETGEFGNLTKRAPRLVETIGRWNVVHVHDRYVGIPQEMGELDLRTVDLDSLAGVVMANRLPDIRRRIQEAIAGSPPAAKAPPVLVESIGTWNVVAYDDRYLGIPQALGPMDLTQVSLEKLSGVMVGKELPELRRKLRAAG
ncbi:MAG: radical SAM protein [Planctomycetes bacterium]|nr:radical SAM protein [Planctomycetota bacterium]